MPFTRQMIEDAIAQCDATDAECAEWERAQVKTREAGGLIYKNHEPAGIDYQQLRACLQEATQSLEGYLGGVVVRLIERRLYGRKFKEALAEAISGYVHGRLKDETRKLRKEIAVLRAELRGRRHDA
jgi:hypothetical protein